MLRALSVAFLFTFSNATRANSRPKFMNFSRSTSRRLLLIAVLARPVAAISIQFAGGVWPSAVIIWTDWPLRSRVQSGTRIPSTFADTQAEPIRV